MNCISWSISTNIFSYFSKRIQKMVHIPASRVYLIIEMLCPGEAQANAIIAQEGLTLETLTNFSKELCPPLCPPLCPTFWDLPTWKEMISRERETLRFICEFYFQFLENIEWFQISAREEFCVMKFSIWGRKKTFYFHTLWFMSKQRGSGFHTILQ